MKQSVNLAVNLNCGKIAAAPWFLAAALLLLFPAAGELRAQGGSSGQSAAPAGNAAKGEQLFNSYGCYACHGKEAQGGVAGPRIGPNPPVFAGFVAYVRKPVNQMPPFTDQVVSDADLADIYAFLQSRAKPKPVKDIPLLND